MSIETRLRNGADEARRISAEFDQRGIEARSASFARRAAFVAAAGAVVVAIAIAGIWASTWILDDDDEIADLPSPDHEWQQVETPPEVDVIQDIWVDGEGFNIWSGNELWTSRDGHKWSLEIETPAELGGYAVRGSLVRHGDGWIGVGNPNGVPTSYRFENDEWIASELSTGSATVAAWMLAANEAGVVAAGASVGGSDISTLLLWFSHDGVSWQLTELGEGYPIALDSSDSGFAIVAGHMDEEASIWTSVDGIEWTNTALLPAYSTSSPVLFRDMLLAVSRQSEVVALGSGGEARSISAGPEFAELAQSLSLGAIDAGSFGILVSAFDSSTENVPVITMWFSHDTEQWMRYDLVDLFGEQGTILATVGDDRLLVAFEPGGSAYMSPETPYQLWVGTARP